MAGSPTPQLTAAGDRHLPPPGPVVGPELRLPALPPLPVLPEPSSAIAGAAMVALPIASGAGALVMALSRPGSPLAIGSLVVLVASVLVGALLLLGQRHSARSRLRRHRRRYLGIVDEADRRLRGTVRDRRTRAARPEPPGAPQESAGRLRVRVRVGTATMPCPVPLPAPHPDELAEVDPVCAAAVADLRTRRGTAHGVPLDLVGADAARIGVVGPEDLATALLRAMLLDLVKSVPPARLAVVVRGGIAAGWARWLPHCSSAIVAGRPGALQGDLVDPAADPLPRLLAVPGLWAVLEVDVGPPRAGGPARDVGGDHRDPRVFRWSRLTDGAPGDPAATRIEVGSDAVVTMRWPGGPVTGRGDLLSAAQARMVARDLAGHAFRAPRGVGPSAGPADADTPDHPASSGTGYLRAVVGHRPDGMPVVLDLKDAARDGMGPHGLIVGATGAGKSELLRTLTLRLAQGHAPDDLTLLLVDYKGGSTFAAFAGLPHVVGMLTNLADDSGLVERFAIALRGESTRRQAVLARAGVSDVAAYRRLTDPPEPLPTLLVVVDEYAELVTAHPDVADLFVQLGRIGRSLGLHLLLATQRLDAGRSRGVEGQLSYRVVLRTFTAAESQELLGSTAAFTLPRTPGEALLGRAGQDPIRFRVDQCAAATASDPVGPSRTGAPRPFPVSPVVLDRLGRLDRLQDDPFTAIAPAEPGDPLVAAVGAVVDRWSAGPDPRAARPIWLPPLPSRLTLADLPGPVPGGPSVVVPFGLLDLPAQQRQQALTWAPAEQPNLLVTGTGRSGRTSALLTVIAATGWVATPGAVSVYAVGLGGPGLAAAAGWPHVVGVAPSDDPDLTRRLLGLVAEEVGRREQATAAGRSATSGASPRWPLVLLVVDDWAPSGTSEDDVDHLVAEVARRGPAVGVASAVATAAGVVLRGRIAGSFGYRVELRPADAFESAIDRQRAAALPADVPGRALVTGGYAQLAQPPDPSPQAVDTDEFVRRVHRRWADHPTTRRRPLPAEVRLSTLLVGEQPVTATHAAGTGRRTGAAAPPASAAALTPPSDPSVLLGVEEADGPAVRHVFGRADPHLLVLGDPGSGRTAALRALARQLGAGRARTPSRPAPLLVAVDLRGGLTEPFDLPFAADTDRDPGSGPAHDGSGVTWAATVDRVDRFGPVIDGVLRHLRPEVTPGPPGSGRPGPADTIRPPIFLLVDDEELLTSGGLHPLAPLLPALRSGADLGVHLVVARSSGGYARARFEPLHQMLADLGTPTLLLSASPEEGALNHRLRPRRLPPGRGQWAARGRPTRLVQTPLPDDRPPTGLLP